MENGNRITPALRKLLQEKMDLYKEHVPYFYTDEVKGAAKKLGYPIPSISKIRNVYNQKQFDIHLTEMFEVVYNDHKEKYDVLISKSQKVA